MAGLAAAVDLARRGCDTTVVEQACAPGGKMREISVGGRGIDAGPTVFTMRWVFEDLFSACGRELTDQLDLVPAECLARHAWRAGGQLDLFADIERSTHAIAEFSGSRDAAGYRDFCKRSSGIFATLRDSFIASQRPSPLTLTRRVGLRHIDRLWRTVPYRTLWSALSDHFQDPRLRQLFGRYATYTGCSPLAAPATLMLVAHVEQDGVWLVRGGMRRVADALQSLAESQGARFRFGTRVAEIIAKDRVSAVLLESGEHIEADAVVFNGDVSALAQGMLGNGVSTAAKGTAAADRSLSAITWCVQARTSGFPLEHHNVFFAEDYPSEFTALFGRRTITPSPTVYLCAQDRGAA
jgi:1-hydroxycarotenoid 3,4-desaturase